MPTSASRLPARPSLEHLRKQAKNLLRDFERGDEAARDRFRATNATFVEPASIRDTGLAQAQFVIAREYGFESWAKLVHHVEALAAIAAHEYSRMAETIADAYSTGNAAAIRALNSQYAMSFPWDRLPARMLERLPTWFASENRTADLALADARMLVARHVGFDTWDELAGNVASGASAPSGRPTAAPGFYSIDEERRTIETHGPVSDAEWDIVFALLAERKLTGLVAGGQMTDKALARLARVGHLTFLDIGGSNAVTDDGLQHIAQLAHLEALHLGGWDSAVSDNGLRVLRNLGKLRDFRMGWHQRLSDAAMIHLAACTKLENVNLMGTRTGDGAIVAMAGKENLCRLRTGYNVTARGLPALHQIPSFRTWRDGKTTFAMMGAEVGPTMLMVPQRPFADGGLDALRGLDGLFGLNLFGMGEAGGAVLTARGARSFADHTRIGWLACDPGDGAMNEFGAMPALRMLLCQDSHATDEGFVALSRSRSLEYIWGRDTRNLTARGLAALSTIPTLRGLATTLANVNDAGLAVLGDFPALRELLPMGLGDAGFRHVARCEHLEALWLMYCPESGDGSTEHIAGLRELKTYYAGGNRITDRSLEILGTMDSLEDIRLADLLRVTDAGVALLARLPNLRSLLLEAVPGVSRAGLRALPKRVEVKYGW